MTSAPVRKIVLSSGIIIALFALFKLILHLAVSGRYGYFIDELYTIAMSRHPSLGYVDLPPFVPLLLTWFSAIFGVSLPALRFLPAVCGALMIVVSGLMVRKMGGGRFAVLIACLAVTVVPIWLTMDSMYTYDSFDQLFTSIFFYFLIALLRDENPRTWLFIGLFAGITLMTKTSMSFFGLGLLISLILTKNRKYFTDKNLWIGGAIAAAIFLPYIVWEIVHRWPTVEYWINYSQSRTYHATPLEFLFNQLMVFQPVTFPLWLSGLIYFFFHSEGKRYRMLGVLYIVMFFIFMLTNAKFYMLGAAYPMLFAGGAVLLEKSLSKKGLFWIKPLYIAVIAAAGIILAPVSLPVLSPENLAKYFKVYNSISALRSVKTENTATLEFPQYIADRFGWEEVVQAISKAYHDLTPEEQKKCMIIGGYYGPAGAVDLLGKKYGLPNAVSGALSYYLWGYGNNTGEIAIAAGFSSRSLLDFYQSVEIVETAHSKYSMPNVRNMPIYLCRGPKYPIAAAWQYVKNYH